MALKSTIFKAQVSVSDISRGHYADYSLTLAQHPSETDERLLFRLLAFALHADEELSFGKGLSTEDEPDLWLKTLDGRIENWVDLGQPDEKRLRQACGKSGQVNIYCYQLGAARPWWQAVENKVQNLQKLRVSFLKVRGENPLTALIDRNMQLTCTIQDNEVLLVGGETAIGVEILPVKR